MQAGSGEDPTTFPASIDTLMTQLLERGVNRVLWVNFPERRLSADGTPAYAPLNAALAAAAERWSQLTVLDWNTASGSDDADRWFVRGTDLAPDYLNLTPAGRTRFALFVRTQLDGLRLLELLPKSVNTTPVTTASTVASSSTVATSTTAPTSTTAASSTSAPVTTLATTTTSMPVSTLPRSKQRLLKVGARGTAVREVQRVLRSYGYPVRVTGYFSNATRKHLREFQKANGIPTSGVVGSTTWRALGFQR